MTSRSHHFEKTPSDSAPNAPQIDASAGQIPAGLSMSALQQMIAQAVVQAQTSPDISLNVEQIESLKRGWLVAGKCAQRSPRTLETREAIIDRLVWWCHQNGHATIGVEEIRSFLGYVAEGTPEGRWGNPRLTARAMKSTNNTYYGYLSAFFGWLRKQELIVKNPMDKIDRPGGEAAEVQPFGEDDVLRLVTAAEKTTNPRRDVAIVWTLIDTGVRASELCALTRGDVDLMGQSITIRKGKGNKGRTVYFGQTCSQAIWKLMREIDAPDTAPLFAKAKGIHAGERMDRFVLGKLLKRLNRRAKIGVRCSPHTGRHTFGVTYLRNDGGIKGLMRLLGHRSLAMSMVYANIAECDVAESHRRSSPADNIKANAKK